MQNLLSLHNAIAQICPIDGVSDKGDGTFRIDYKPEATNEQKDQAIALATEWADTPDPDWQKLFLQFQFPGNPLYGSVAGKVAAAGFLAQDHWSNFKILLTNPQLQSVEALSASISRMAQILDEAAQPLGIEDIEGWNDFMDECDFPEICKLAD